MGSIDLLAKNILNTKRQQQTTRNLNWKKGVTEILYS